MAKLTRYLVRFNAAAGVYNAGEEAALSVDDYKRELERKPAPVIELLETIEDEIGGDGKAIPGAQKRTKAPATPASPALASKDAEIASLKAQLQAATERSVLGTDPDKAKLQKAVDELTAQKAELEKKLAQAVEHAADVEAKAKAAAIEGGNRIAELEADLAALKAKKPKG